MQLRILGPIEAYDSSGTALRLPAGRERALFAALLLRRNEVVSIDALLDALWGATPPSTAPKAVQGYVSHLRRLLGEDASRLVTQAPGYVLRVEDEEVDAARFERLAADARRALDDGDPAETLRALDEALALWRGPVLAEFAYDDFAQREIQRLTELRLEAGENRIDALLQLGRHSGLVAELEAAVAANPLRERSRGQLMLALYRSGRTPEALAVYKDAARQARDLGLDPAPSLRALERAILEQDPAITAPTPPSTVARVPLPAGTVTLMSSDIVGSTKLVRRMGPERWGALLSRHQTLMRRAFAAHGGSEVDTQGDAFFAAFDTAERAVRAALAVQRSHLEEPWSEDEHVHVRVGLHTGAPVAGHERYVGLDVHRVARVAAAAHGGEILCTASTAALVSAGEIEGVRLVDLGEFTLKDFPQPERLLRVVGDGLPDDFPPPEARRVEPRWSGRRRRALAAAVFAVTLVVVAGALLLIRSRDTPAAAVVAPAVVVIDPETNRIVTSLDVGRRPVALASGFGSVWVGDSAENTVARIDPENLDGPITRIGIGATAVDIAAGLGGVWAATGSFGEVVKIDPSVDSATERFALPEQNLVVPNATSVSATSDGLWVVATEKLLRLDPRSGRVSKTVDLGSIGLWVSADGGSVWSTTYANRAVKVDASAGEVVADFYPGLFMLPIVAKREAVWIGGLEGQVWRLDPETATQTGGGDASSSDGYFAATGLDVDDDAVWICIADDGNVVRLDPASGNVTATIPVGAAPGDVLVAHGYVWVTVLPPDEASSA